MTHFYPPTHQCLDEHLNVILQHATERRRVREPTTGGEQAPPGQTKEHRRNLGLVLLPGKHVVKVEVKERDPLEVPR